jgi:hypothetical protein
MLKFLNTLLGFLMLTGLIVCTKSAYTQTATSAADYWPMKKGNTWSMLVKIGTDIIKKQVWKITNVEKTNDATIATLEISSATILQTEHFKVTSTQIESLELGGGLYKLDTPLPIVKFPLTAGKTWSYKGTFTSLEEKPVKATATFTVSGPFQIKSPAGSFQAMCVHRELVFTGDKGSTHLPNDCWYAPGVGMVQQRYAASGITPTGNVKIQNYKLEAGKETPKKSPHRHGS